jgi:hypothetical protein
LFRNVLVIAVVSNAANTNQHHISKTIGATKYMVWKAVECHVHVDETKKFVGGIALEALL